MLVDGKQTKDRSLARFVCPPAFVHFTIVMRADFQAYRDHEKAEAVYKLVARPVRCVLAGTLLTVMNKLLLKLQKLLTKFLRIFT